MERLEYREIEQFARRHDAAKWWGWDLTPGCVASVNAASHFVGTIFSFHSFTDENTNGQRSSMTCPGSRSKQMAELGLAAFVSTETCSFSINYSPAYKNMITYKNY